MKQTDHVVFFVVVVTMIERKYMEKLGRTFGVIGDLAYSDGLSGGIGVFPSREMLELIDRAFVCTRLICFFSATITCYDHEDVLVFMTNRDMEICSKL